MQKITPPTQTKTTHQPLRVGLFGIGLALAFATSLHAGETLAATHAVEVAGLRCEYLENPLGIDVANMQVDAGTGVDKAIKRIYDTPNLRELCLDFRRFSFQEFDIR